MSDDGGRIGAVASEAWERANEPPESNLSDKDYLSRYENEDGEFSAYETFKTGINRVFFALDSIGGGGDKPPYVHFLIGVFEVGLSLTEGED